MRRWDMTIVYVALIALFVAGFWLYGRRIDDLALVNRQLRVAEIDRTFKQCGDTVDFRRTFAEFLDQAARPSGAGVDFSQLASFADLDPATKRFLVELSTITSSGTDRVQVIADQYRERFFPLPDCDKNRAVALAHVPG